jgi:hypothetical protein
VELLDSNQEKFFGVIDSFLEYSNQKFCIINLLENLSDNYIVNNLSSLTQKHFKNYFINVKRSNKLFLAKLSHIARRAVLVEAENNLFVSTCIDLNEHD